MRKRDLCGHMIEVEKPEVVIDVIHEVIKKSN